MENKTKQNELSRAVIKNLTKQEKKKGVLMQDENYQKKERKKERKTERKKERGQKCPLPARLRK